MEAQQEQAAQNYGEGFRKGVTRLLDEVQKLDFLSSEAKASLTNNAAKLCLAEALAEQKATELAKKAKGEWDDKYKKQVETALEGVTAFSLEQAKLLKTAFDKWSKKG